MKILILGGAGMVGRKLVERLARDGQERLGDLERRVDPGDGGQALPGRAGVDGGSSPGEISPKSSSCGRCFAFLG